MQLANLIQDTGLQLTRGDGAVELADLVDDSRRATPGCAFIARPGVGGDGRAHCADAVSRGAVAVIDVHSGPPTPFSDLPKSVAIASPDPDVVNVDQSLVARLADRFFGSPSTQLDVIAVTGTNGKTTVTFIAQHLLTCAGVRAGLIGTVFTDLGGPDHTTPSALTTPGAIDVQRMLRAMLDRGCRAAVLEASSHALHQGRLDATAVNAAVFTNLTGDHLDYHGDMDAYADAKALLFEGLGPDAWAVINIDDPHWLRMAPPEGRIVYTTLDHPATDLEPAARATIHAMTASGSEVTFSGPWGEMNLTLPLVGRHNVSNALQAAAASHAVTGCDAATLRRGLETCPATPGRLERVGDRDDRPTVLVDYAHTHDALLNVLSAVKPLTAGRLIVVFGCGGDRDRTKRPKMAAAAEQWGDVVYVTSDNPRTEDPGAIIRDATAGLSRPDAAIVEPDRAAAIAHAIGGAGPDDTVLIAGKGHEDYQILPAADGGTARVRFDDREHAAAALQQWSKESHARCEPST